MMPDESSSLRSAKTSEDPAHPLTQARASSVRLAVQKEANFVGQGRYPGVASGARLAKGFQWNHAQLTSKLSVKLLGAARASSSDLGHAISEFAKAIHGLQDRLLFKDSWEIAHPGASERKAIKGGDAGEQLVQERTQRIHIRPRLGQTGFIGRLLRRQILDCTVCQAGFEPGSPMPEKVMERAGHSEVGDHDRWYISGHADNGVSGIQACMNDAALVSGRNRFARI